MITKSKHFTSTCNRDTIQISGYDPTVTVTKVNDTCRADPTDYFVTQVPVDTSNISLRVLIWNWNFITSMKFKNDLRIVCNRRCFYHLLSVTVREAVAHNWFNPLFLIQPWLAESWLNQLWATLWYTHW